MKKLWLIALLGACGGDAPNDLVSCGDWPDLATNSTWRCEAACENQPQGFGGSGPGQQMPCTGVHATEMFTDQFRCTYPFTYDGHLGCCEAMDTDRDPTKMGPMQVWFYECPAP